MNEINLISEGIAILILSIVDISLQTLLNASNRASSIPSAGKGFLLYVAGLIAVEKDASCSKMADVMGKVSHDKLTRILDQGAMIVGKLGVVFINFCLSQLKRKVVLPVSVSLECGGIKLVGVDAYRGLAFGLNWDTVVRENMDGYLLDNADALRYFSGRVKGLVPRDMDKGGTLLLAFYHLISLSEALSVKPVYVEASASIGGTIYSGSMCVAHYVTHEVDRRDFFRIGIERDRWRMRISEVQIK